MHIMMLSLFVAPDLRIVVLLLERLCLMSWTVGKIVVPRNKLLLRDDPETRNNGNSAYNVTQVW